jgi:predicted outer membrane repeat protein
MIGKHDIQKRMSRFLFTCFFIIAPLLLLSLAPIRVPAMPTTGTISGRVIYYGNIIGHKIYISAHIATNVDPVASTNILNPGGDYTIGGVPDGTYYVGAFLDVNDSGGGPPDAGEPQAWYDSDGDGDADTVTVSGGDLGNINIPLGTIIYVNASASGLNNGTSWLNAYTSLLNAESDPKTATAGTEIWVAAGTYTPGASRSSFFTLKNGLAIYGGFAGDEMLRSQRFRKANITILSGDIGTIGTWTDNVYHVIYAASVDNSAILGDVTIMDGRADSGGDNDKGGGILLTNGAPTLVNIRFLHNYAVNHGGGIATQGSTTPRLKVINCTFSGNQSDANGAGIAVLSSAKADILNSTFTGNDAPAGAITVLTGGTTSATLKNVITSGNDHRQIGVQNSSPTDVHYSVVAGGCPADAGLTCTDHVITTAATFVSANGADGVRGTLDDNLRLQITSSGIDAGDNSLVPTDAADIDGDGNTTEILPIDFANSPRFTNVPSVADTGSGTPPIVDMGAFEYMYYTFLPLVLK